MAKKKKKKQNRLRSILNILVVFGVSGLLIGLFVFADRYLDTNKANQSGPLIFDDVPHWVQASLMDKVYAAVGGREFIMDESVARTIWEALKSVAWLDQTQVHVAQDGIHVQAKWRKPLVILKRGLGQFYVDVDLIVLDAFPLTLPLVTVQLPLFNERYVAERLIDAVAAFDWPIPPIPAWAFHKILPYGPGTDRRPEKRVREFSDPSSVAPETRY